MQININLQIQFGLKFHSNSNSNCNSIVKSNVIEFAYQVEIHLQLQSN